MSTKELVDALLSGDAKDIQKQFNNAIGERIVDRLDTMRQEVSQRMFSSVQEDSDLKEDVDDVNAAIQSGKKWKKKENIRIKDKADNDSDRAEVNGIMANLRRRMKTLGQAPGDDEKADIAAQVAGPGNFNVAVNKNTHVYNPFKPKPAQSLRTRAEAQFESYSHQELTDFTKTPEFDELSEEIKATFMALLADK